MKAFAVVLLFCTFGALSGAEGLLKWPGEWVPYMERIDNNDFLVVENSLKETASDDSLLVIYEITAGEFWGRRTLKKAAESGYQLEILTTDYRTRQRTIKTVKLPTDIGGRLMEAITFVMTKKVYPSSNRSLAPYMTSGGSGGTIWVRQKSDSDSIISGMIDLSRCGHGEISTPPFFNLMRRLTMCANDDPSDGPPLVKLDLAITALQSSYPD